MLADLAALFDYRWARQRDREGRTSYILKRDVRNRRREEELRRIAARRLAERMEEQLRALQEPPEQLARRPERDPVRELLENPETRLGTELYSELNPRQRELLFLQRRLNFPFRSLEPRYQQPLRREFSERLRFFEEWLETQPELREKLRKAPPGSRSELLVDRAEDLERGSVRFRVRHTGGMVIVALGVGILPFTVDVNTQEGRTEVVSGLGFWLVGMVDERATWVLPPHGDPYTGEPVRPATRLPSSEAAAAATAERSGSTASGRSPSAAANRCLPISIGVNR